MAKSTTFSNQLLLYLCNGTALPWAGNANLYIALHTADPGTNQSNSEIVYNEYARVALPRTGSGWTVTGAVLSNAVDITFPSVLTQSGTYSYISIGVSQSGSSTVLWSGIVSGAPISWGVGNTPKITAGNLQVTES